MSTQLSEDVRGNPIEEMYRVININVPGILATTQAALKHMKSGARISELGSQGITANNIRRVQSTRL